MRACLVWLAVFAAACGGGTSSVTSSPMNGPGNPPGPSAAQISVGEYAFTPASVSIKAGTSVTWTNDGALAHTATADGGAFDSGQLAPPGGGGGYGGTTMGGSYTFTFTSPGTYSYHCANHPTQMKGTITVTP